MEEKPDILPAGLPPGVETAQEAGDQEKEGLSPRQQRIATLLNRLATTARSFLLYDPHNEAIHRFITQLLDAFVSALGEEGPLAFGVQPFELTFEGVPVYLNRDRERSLAFRFYRDGVRSLRFLPGFDWEELAKLLEVLSIRYTGIHQREEDVVTLLWKADFAHLEFEAVEGIVPEDDELVSEAAQSWVPPPVVLPDDVDLPRPALPTPAAPTWTAVGDEARERLRGEASAAQVPEDCLALLAELRARLNDEALGRRFEEVAHIFIEVRDHFVAEAILEPLKRFIVLLWEMAAEEAPAWDQARHTALYELLDACGDRQAVRRLLRSVPPHERKLRPELLEVLSRVCPDPLAAVADALVEEPGPAARAVARQLLEHYGAKRLPFIQERFKESSGHVASDLLRVVAGIGGEEAAAFIAQQASHQDKAVLDEALWHLEHMAYSGAVGRALFDAFRWTDAGRRGRVLAMMSRTRDRRFVDLLAAYVDEQAGQLAPAEAAQIGQVIGQLAGEASAPRWREWLQATGIFRKGIQGPLARQVAAALALSEIRADEAGKILEEALEVADPEAEPWILGALGQRERNFSRGNP